MYGRNVIFAEFAVMEEIIFLAKATAWKILYKLLLTPRIKRQILSKLYIHVYKMLYTRDMQYRPLSTLTWFYF